MIRVDSECFEDVTKIYLKLLDLLGEEKNKNILSYKIRYITQYLCSKRDYNRPNHFS